MRITIFGAGYVGLVQAAVLASVGHEVCCVDVDRRKIAALQQGIVPIFEPGLEALVRDALADGKLVFTAESQFGVDYATLQFIAVGTPPDEDGSADLAHVLQVADAIAKDSTGDRIVVIKSTVPVGAADRIAQRGQEIIAKKPDSAAFVVVSNPEFLKEGAAVADCRSPERIIIGTDSQDAEQLLRELYAPFNRNHDRILVMDRRSAELTKYAANCMLATRISFMNEMANIAELTGADIENVRLGIGSDSRIGTRFIYPGCGFGGGCLPKDIRALQRTAVELGYTPQLLEAIDDINERQKSRLYETICRVFTPLGEGTVDLSGRCFALWGLSFKPDTDDMKEAPSRVLIELLLNAGARVQAWDPKAMDEAGRIYAGDPDFLLAADKEAALEGACALVICTEWQQFRAPDFALIKSQLQYPVIFDGRNMYDPKQLQAWGIEYYGMGRSSTVPRSGLIAGQLA